MEISITITDSAGGVTVGIAPHDGADVVDKSFARPGIETPSATARRVTAPMNAGSAPTELSFQTDGGPQPFIATGHTATEPVDPGSIGSSISAGAAPSQR